MTTSDTVIERETTTRVGMQPPRMFNVVLYNDDSTTVEFVGLVLMTIFHKSFESASALTMQIHEKGRGIAGTYSFEVATQKKEETTLVAKANGCPLRCEVEKA